MTPGQGSSCGSEGAVPVVCPSPSAMVSCSTNNEGRSSSQLRPPLRAGSLRLSTACPATQWLYPRPDRHENARKCRHPARDVMGVSGSAACVRGSQGFLVAFSDFSVGLHGSPWRCACRITFTLHTHAHSTKQNTAIYKYILKYIFCKNSTLNSAGSYYCM